MSTVAAREGGTEFTSAMGIDGVSWTDPPYLEVGIASLVALVLLVPHVHEAPDSVDAG